MFRYFSLFALSTLFTVPLSGQVPDSSYLYGIHYYGDVAATGPTDVETMTGNRGVWVLDQSLLNGVATRALGNEFETPWVTSPTIDRNSEWAKPGWMRNITGKGHSLVMRLQPQWDCQVPYPGNAGLSLPADPYTSAQYADDAKAAANLMKNVHIWVVGNELNLEQENRRWNSSTQRYDLPWPAADLETLPELYGAQYVATRDKIHEITPNTFPGNQVVLMQPASPGAVNNGVGRFMHSSEFLFRMIQAVPDKSKIDGFALHSYADPATANAGADGFMLALKEQLAIIDQFGLGDRPIYITEFNRHMPNASDVAAGAQFVTASYQQLHGWNTSSGSLWPAHSNHKIAGTNWFVYPSSGANRGDGWNAYSLLFNKTNSPGGTGPTQNPWYAFQAICGQNYPRGDGAGTYISPSTKWWEDDFNGSALDTALPFPVWQSETGNGGQVQLSGAGAVRLISTANFSDSSIRIPQNWWSGDFKALVDLAFVDAGRRADGEANFDFRIRERLDKPNHGYSLTLYSSGGTTKQGMVELRQAGNWGNIYESGTIAGGINTGDRFRIEVTANGNNLQYRVWRLPSMALVLDWTGPNAVVNSDMKHGSVRCMAYNLREAQVEHFQIGGVSSALSGPSSAADWQLLQ